jgi:hypothetical protein
MLIDKHKQKHTKACVYVISPQTTTHDFLEKSLSGLECIVSHSCNSR